MAKCQPCKCTVVDGFLSFMYLLLIMSLAVLVAIIELDKKLDDNDNCSLVRFNMTPTSDFKIPGDFIIIVCYWFSHVIISLMAIAFMLIVTNWAFGCSVFLCWWVMQMVIGIVMALVTLAISVVLSTMLFILCGQLYGATNISSCIDAVIKYDRLHSKIHSSESMQTVFDHRVIAMTAAWIAFFSSFIACYLILVRICHIYYQKKLAALELIAEDVRQADRRERAINTYGSSTNTQHSYDVDPPSYNSLSFTHRATAPEQEPLIHFSD